MGGKKEPIYRKKGFCKETLERRAQIRQALNYKKRSANAGKEGRPGAKYVVRNIAKQRLVNKDQMAGRKVEKTKSSREGSDEVFE